MKSNQNFFLRVIDWELRFFSYGWTYILIIIYFPFSLLVPRLREVLDEYNASATWRSVTIINLTATTAWMAIFVLSLYWSEPLPFVQYLSNEAIPLLFMYAFGLGFGYAALFTSADYMKKREINGSN